ncbi:MAG: metallophosphoesterase [Candidatus Nanopelagicales bacterium]
MKILAFSDLHLDTPFAWAPPGLARARRQALRDTLQRICHLAATEQVDAVACAGDLYEHDRFTPDTVRFVADQLGGLGRPVFLAPGNHDWYGPASLYRQAHWSSTVHVFTQDRLEPFELADGVTLWGAAHRAPANTEGFLDGFTVDRGGINLALFHGSEQGALPWQDAGKRPHAPFTESQIEAAGLDHAFCGHFHSPKLATRHTYPGNPDPLTFGETGQRGAVIATVAADGSVDRTVHPVATTTVQDVTVHLRDASHADHVRQQVEAGIADLTGIVRVTVSGEVGPDVDIDLADLRGLGRHLDGLVTRLGSISVAYDLDRLAEEPTVRGQFVRDVRAAPGLDEDTRRRVLITGLRALSGRADLEVH